MPELRDQYDIDEVRERTDLPGLIGQYGVTLKKRGNRYSGLCPFHQEKSPSFSVDGDKGLWHCFGCGKGGNAFTFVELIEGLSFPEALEKLAERAGVRPRVQAAGVPQHRKEEKDFLFEANAAAAQAFSAALRGKAGVAARGYLEQRGITEEAAKRFGLGYAPAGWDALVKHLRQRGFSGEVLVTSGLALPRSNGEGIFDRFRHRLMIPIHDRQGRVVAFGGRALAKEDNPKYLNTAETPVFHKGRTLYLLHVAAETIQKTPVDSKDNNKIHRAIITEGYFDAIACHLAGFTEAVATLGTALGEEHVQLLRRLAGENGRIYLVFDADSAGLNAALRSQAMFRDAGVDVRIVRLPAGHDPDTLLREGGREAFEQCLTDAMSPVLFELDRLLQQHPASDPEGRVQLFRASAKVLQPLAALERAEYAERLVWMLQQRQGAMQGDVAQLQQAILSEIGALDRMRRRGGDAAPATTTPTLRDVPLEREVMTQMVRDAQFATEAVILLPTDSFTVERYRSIFQEFGKLVDLGVEPETRLINTNDGLIMTTIAELVLRDPDPLEAHPSSLLDRMIEEYSNRLVMPQAIELNREAAESFVSLIQERSLRNKERNSSEISGKWKTTQPDEDLRKHLDRYKK